MLCRLPDNAIRILLTRKLKRGKSLYLQLLIWLYRLEEADEGEPLERREVQQTVSSKLGQAWQQRPRNCVIFEGD